MAGQRDIPWVPVPTRHRGLSRPQSNLSLVQHHVCALHEHIAAADADDGPDDRRMRDTGVPAHHDVADPADAGAGVVANGTPTQVRQRDHQVADGPADGDLLAQRGAQPVAIRWWTLVRVRYRVPRSGVVAPVVDSFLVVVDRRSRSGHPATASRALPVTFWTFFTSLRIPNPEITSITPRTISQMPTTRASVTIESIG